MQEWLRVQTDEEYETYARLRNTMYPLQPTDGVQMRASGERTPASAGLERYLMRVDGDVVGAGLVLHAYFFEAPELFVADALVPPGGTEVFRILHAKVFRRAEEKGAGRVRTMVSSLVPEFIVELEAARFSEVERFPVTSLEVGGFDPRPFLGAADAVARAGIDIVPLTAFVERNPDDWLQRVWRFDMDVSRDMPFREEFAEIPLDSYRGQFVDVPSFDPALHFVALDGEALVGITMLTRVPGDGTLLGTGLTGVDRAYRRRGLATALKLRAIEAARERGVHRIVTENEASNPMLQLNILLGFGPAYDEVVLERSL